MTRLLAFALLLAGLPSAQAVELPRIFADGMVLQREQPIPVWGRATPGATVRVLFDGDAASAVADANGDWQLRLPAHAAGGPLRMRIDDGHAPVELRDVLVGEVWLASGQSNMEWPLAQTDAAEAVIAAANDPLIRHFKIPKSWAGTPQWQIQDGQWLAASPTTADEFSAAAYYFATALRKATGVPVGIIDSTWGGSSIEAWMDAAALGLDPAAVDAQARQLRKADTQALAQTRDNLRRWPAVGGEPDWARPGIDDAGWAEIAAPGLWEGAGWNGMDGIAWYRKTFTLSAAEAKAGIRLGLGRIDDSDIAWVNGVQVGQTRMQYNQPRVYPVPAAALRAGVNVIAVRVEDTGGGGGLHGDADELFVQPANAAPRTLAGRWKFRPQQVTVALVDDKNQQPTALYNAMIHPLQSYGLRGVIWYQGEANANTVEQAQGYRDQFPALIRQWRRQFDQPALPFLWVQLASFGSGLDHAADSPWAVLRESQTAALSLPATAQVVTLDIGNSLDIHPRNKQDVGKRLALAARSVAYGETLVHRGPVHRHVRFADHAAWLDFDDGGAALTARSGGRDLQGFVVAGADRVFHPARARIEGNGVVVRSDAVVTPVAVRYGWQDDAGDADLVNAAGLPASPFRSDDW